MDNTFELYCQGKYYGFVRIEDLPNHTCNFHINITRFSHNILNRMKRDEVSLMSHIKNMGYDELISFVDTSCVNHGDVTLWTKFIKLFGFDEPKLFTRRIV
jgi:hypothetical protein